MKSTHGPVYAMIVAGALAASLSACDTGTDPAPAPPTVKVTSVSDNEFLPAYIAAITDGAPVPGQVKVGQTVDDLLLPPSR
jgi:hypothetical protein